MTTKLSQPAPRRASVRTLMGYHSQPFTVQDVELTLAGGGWFLKGGYHEFADVAASRAAGVLPPKKETKLDRLMAGFDDLPEEMQIQLLQQLQ